MNLLMSCRGWLVLLVSVFVLLPSRQFAAQVPAEVGTTVNGFQDDFDGSSLNPGWVVRGANVYTANNGVLTVTTASGDPNHLLCEVAGYNNSVQEVLARIRVLNFGSGDASRGGIATVVDANTSQGINLHFRDEPSAGQRHLEFLDDQRAWGIEFPLNWQNNTWYWLRLRHEPNAPSQGGINDVFMKVWLADGAQVEPAVWQAAYDYIPTRTARTGFAGIVASSVSGVSEFEVDYILIKASGLPSIVVAPNAFVQTPAAITNQPQSQTVVEGSFATFAVGAAGNPRPTYQWYRGNAVIPGATEPSYTLPVVSLSDSGAVFRVVVENVVSNTTYTVTSSNAILSVVADNTAPRLVLAQAIGLTQVQLGFSERVTAATATNRSNYQITNSSGSLLISSAALDGSLSNVVLNVAPMTEGATYTVVVNNVRDSSTAGNLIAPNTTTNFTAISFTPASIGNPQPSGGAVGAPGGLDVTGGGLDIGGTSDQFQFNYQGRTDDFDVKVRVAGVSLADAWSEAGLLAREDLTAGSRFAAVMTTPNISGSYFQYRSTASAAASIVGSFPANHPNTWLRLQRVGSQFTGYAGFDGENWTSLGTVSIAMPATVFLGFAASSHNTNQTTTAAFRDFGNVTSAGVNTGPLPVEPLGQSSRRTSVVFSEIMYNPLDRPDGRNLEFVELFNSLATPEDIGGFRLDGDADFTFPPGTVIPGGGFLVVAQSPADVESVYGISGVLGPFSNTNSLPNDRGSVQLRNRIGAVFLEATYDTQSPWPAAADGAGHSLVLARPSYGERDPRAWAASDSVGGSPGRLDPMAVDPLRNVVINEFLANTDIPDLDFIELYNHGNDPLDISGCYLSDSRNTNKFAIGPNTMIPARGFISFNENQLGFALSSGGEGIYFRNASGTRVLDAVRFGPQATGVSSGRYPDGSLGITELAAVTPGTNNAASRHREIVINEIMYNPISRDSDDEFVELHNRGSNSVSVAGWRLGGGISLSLPMDAAIPAGGYLVVARDAARLISRYPNLSSNNTVGNYNGSLANGGERIALEMPSIPFPTNSAGFNTNVDYITVDEVTYVDGGRWGRWSDGGGSSLELIDPRGDNRLAANWADSDESSKAPWTIVSTPGVLDNGTSAADQLQVLLQGAGECLIDDVEVMTSAGVNLIGNSTFESGATGWTAEGTQSQSGPETAEGYNSARSYHVRAVDRGDNQVNRIRTPLSVAQSVNATNTIRAKVRWLKGHPEILFRLRGNWLEAAVAMDLPTNLGTPGARNSRAVSNAPPAISDVTHTPPVPAANESVVVTARVHDPDGLTSVEVRYRIDPNASLVSVAMRDDGTAGDSVAGDGLFAATIPGRASGTLVAFHVQATDAFSPAATGAFPTDAPARECLVRFGESVPAGNFPSYRIWMTQAAFNAWDTRHNLNNTLNDITFVLGNHRVIYNAAATYAGSPYIGPSFDTPTGRRCGYAVEIPNDDRLLGDNAMNLDWPGGHGNENTAIQEQMAYWMADQMDIAFSHRYFIRLTVNGVTDMQRGGVFEAVIQPGGEFLEQWAPEESEGDFFKIDRAFEFSDTGSLLADPEPQLRIYTTRDLINGGTKKKTEKYRWYWLKRSYETANDYTNLFVIADALNLPPATPTAPTNPELYTAHTEALVDVEQWMGIFAAEHIINNFDSWGHDIGKNMYMFIPRGGGRSQIYMFDLDWLMLVSPGGPGGYTASTGPLFTSDDPTVTRMYNHPPFRRAYFRACERAVDRAFVASKYEAIMDAKYRSLVANGITLCDGQTLAAPTLVKNWFRDRRTYLANQLAAVSSVPFAASGTNFIITNNNLIVVTGTAPVRVTTVLLNGVAWPVNWISVNGWQARIALEPGTNDLEFVAEDYNGGRVGSTNKLTAVFEGPPADPADFVVINEIMYRPVLPDAEFVELFNTSTNTTFNLTQWRFNGLDYTFPRGSLLQPRSFMVLAKDRAAFDMLFGGEAPVFDRFAGNLQSDGETLTLLRPQRGPDDYPIIDRVRYENIAPWPAKADGGGGSLQLIDPTQDNARVSNWSDGEGWRRVIYTSTIQGSATQPGTNFLIFLDSPGDVYMDDIVLVEGTVPEAGPNILVNGDFESPLSGPWIVSANVSNSVISTEFAHSGAASLHLLSRTGGGVPASSLNQIIPGRTTNYTATLSFWYLPSTNGNNIAVRTSPGTAFLSRSLLRPVYHSPGAINTILGSVPPYPALWLNEIQPENITGMLDSAGQREPWVELYNAGPMTLSLDAFYLTRNYSNLVQWQFPPGTSIAPGEFKAVILDAQPAQSTAAEPHASFRPSSGSGSIALVQQTGSQFRIIDYFNYSGIRPDYAYGSYPDGQPFFRREFYYPTPRGTNNPAAPPAVLFINEWMAQNSSAVADPYGDFDDWFEFYNPGPNPVDLEGYLITDAPGNPSQYYQIPAGYVVPAGGYFLVWADNETDENSSNHIDLHANFRLSQAGESIALYAPDGTLIDSVAFFLQSADVSEGRYPNGASSRVFFLPATPRQPNMAPGNTPPSISPIASRAIYLGQTVSFTATATDLDEPPQTLTFGLQPGAPANASINPGSGLFTWTPSPAQAPSTNSVTVQVTDSGIPNQVASTSLTIRVLLPPRAVASQAGAQVQITFPTIAGKTYRVDYTTNLSAENWIPLGAPVTAASDSLTFPDNLGPDPQRFYRIQVLD